MLVGPAGATYRLDRWPARCAMIGRKASASLAACGESQTALRAAHIHHLFVAEPRNIPDIPTVRRLDLTENLSLWSAEHFHHRLLAWADSVGDGASS
jgi:hypothetical protein